MADIDFGRQTRKGLDELVGNVLNLNAYVEEQGPDGKGPIPVYADPGLTRAGTMDATGECRGLQKNGDVALYHIAGNEIYKVSPSFSGTKIGSLVGNGKVYMAINQAANPQIGIVTADNQYYIIATATDTATIATDGDLPPVNSIDFLNGYFVFSTADGEIWHTQPNDADNVNALSFATAESDPDGLVCVKAHKGFLFAMGKESLEIWRDVGTTPFAFQPEDADIDIGCAAGHSVVEVGDGLAWVDHFRNVRLLRGGAPGVISTHTINRDLEDLTDAELADIEGWRYWHAGHEFYELKSAQWNRIYDVTTGIWHSGESLGYPNRWRQRYALFNNKSVVGSELDGKLYYIDPTVFTEGGTNYIVTAISRPYHAFPNHISCSSLEIDMITGIGIVGSDADAQDPQVSLAVSKNGGKTWGTERMRDIGQIGEYSRNIRFNNLGRANEKGFTFRISSSSAVMRGIIRASGEFEELEA
jgi:stabilization protein